MINNVSKCLGVKQLIVTGKDKYHTKDPSCAKVNIGEYAISIHYRLSLREDGRPAILSSRLAISSHG